MRKIKIISAASLIFIVFAPANAQMNRPTTEALTINDRIRKLEQKTDYFRITRLTRAKSLKRLPSSSAAHTEVGPHERYMGFFPLAGDQPAIVNLWLTLTAQYTAQANLNFRFDIRGARNTADPDLFESSSQFYCSANRNLPSGSGDINLKIFCQGPVNIHLGDGLLLYAQAASSQAFTLSSFAATTHLVSQVIVEPPAE